MFSKIGKGLGDIGKSLLGKISSPIVDGFKSISAIAANILKGGAIIAAMFGIQAFINSDMFPKFLKGLEKFANMIVDFGKATFNYISELYDIFQAEGGGFAGLKAVASKLFTDAGVAMGDFKKTFLISLGVATLAFGAAILFVINTARKMILAAGRGLGRLTGTLPTKGAKNVRGGSVRSGSSGFKMGEMNPKKQQIKPGTIDRMGGVKNIAKTGARTALGAARFAGPVGLAVAGAQGVYESTQAFKNANELFGKEASNFEKMLAGGAGALEGFTFGLLKAENLIKTPAEIIKSEAEKVKKEAKTFDYFDSKDAASAHAKKHGGKVFVNTGKGATKVKGKPVNTHVVIKKEAVEYPHMMYDPKTGKEVEAKTPADHNKYAKMGYTHEKPNTDEALNLAQRMKRSRLMKRMKARIKIGRKRAMKKMANKKTIEKRAMRQARNQIAKKLTRGIPKKELTFARKQEIEKRLSKPALQQRIKRMAKRIFKDVRKKEVERKKG